MPPPQLAELRRSLQDPGLAMVDIFKAAARLASPSTAEAWDGTAQRIAVTGSLTTDFIGKAIACAVFREGVLPQMHSAPYGSYVQELLDPSSALHAFRPELVVVAPDWRDVVVRHVERDAATLDAALAERVQLFDRAWSILEQAGCTIMQHVLVPPAFAYRGFAERGWPFGELDQIGRISAELVERGRGRVHWIETDRLAEAIGTSRWAPERYYVNAKLPFDPQFLPEYLQCFGGAWRAANGRVKKVLVVDLDNTLWGGVIGDDGVENLALGPGSAAGEAFSLWGEYIKGLGARGVVLAVCSKNDPATGALGFTHAHSVLKVEDFAAFECSWQDKVSGLRRIASALNLSLDAFVFADDNPAECDLVRRELPEVAVVELGTDPASFVGRVEAGHWFDMPEYTGEDLRRTAAYAIRRQAEDARDRAPDIASYLAGMQMVGAFYAPRPEELPRVAQLEQKTNQFNLTTRRYDEPAIRAFAARDGVLLRAFTLRDRFGDHGLVSTIVAVREGDILRIDSWLMSCRVFSRTAEDFMMQRLIETARRDGVRRIVGEFVPTEKNAIVAKLYERLGFTQQPRSEARWELDLEAVDGLPALTTFIADADAAPIETASAAT